VSDHPLHEGAAALHDGEPQCVGGLELHAQESHDLLLERVAGDDLNDDLGLGLELAVIGGVVGGDARVDVHDSGDGVAGVHELLSEAASAGVVGNTDTSHGELLGHFLSGGVALENVVSGGGHKGGKDDQQHKDCLHF